MLSTVVFSVLLHFASSDIQFLSPPNGHDFRTNDTILIKWSKVPGASNYTINWDTCDGSLSTSKTPSRCRPRVSLGPFEEGNWNVSVFALNQSGDVIDSGLVSFRVCENLPCSNGTESDEVSNVQFLSPPNGQDFTTGDTALIKWKKVAGVSQYRLAFDIGTGAAFTSVRPTRCNPRFSIGPLPEGYYVVTVYATNRSVIDVINSGFISIRVCERPPCSNGTATEAVCPAGQVLRYYTSPGYKVQEGSPNTTFPAANDDECLDICSKNAQSDGSNQIRVPCKSADFNNQSNQCEIYSTKTYPQGTAILVKDATTNHYEKVCVEATFGDRCRGPYFVEPQMLLSGAFDLRTLFTNDINACLAQCMDSLAIPGFDCQSGVFYFDRTSKNCELVAADRANRTYPGVYAPELTERLVYFESGCDE